MSCANRISPPPTFGPRCARASSRSIEPETETSIRSTQCRRRWRLIKSPPSSAPSPMSSSTWTASSLVSLTNKHSAKTDDGFWFRVWGFYDQIPRSSTRWSKRRSWLDSGRRSTGRWSPRWWGRRRSSRPRSSLRSRASRISWRLRRFSRRGKGCFKICFPIASRCLVSKFSLCFSLLIKITFLHANCSMKCLTEVNSLMGFVKRINFYLVLNFMDKINLVFVLNFSVPICFLAEAKEQLHHFNY